METAAWMIVAFCVGMGVGWLAAQPGDPDAFL